MMHGQKNIKFYELYFQQLQF